MSLGELEHIKKSRISQKELEWIIGPCDGLGNFLDSCKNSRTDERKKREADFLEATKPFFKEEASETFDNFIRWWESNKNDNYWIGISGSWRTINQKVVDDDTEIVRYITSDDIGIITGGALGVDYITTEIVLKEGDPKKQLRIVLPINRYAYMEHFTNSSIRNKINRTQQDCLIDQLSYIDKNFPNIIFDNSKFDEKKFLNFDEEGYRKISYYFRDWLIAYGCDGLIALWVNKSKGVEDTINKVRLMGKPVFSSNELIYSINEKDMDVIRDYEQIKIPNISGDYPIRNKRNPREFFSFFGRRFSNKKG